MSSKAKNHQTLKQKHTVHQTYTQNGQTARQQRTHYKSTKQQTTSKGITKHRIKQITRTHSNYQHTSFP